jgi:hypothetical protein
MAKMKWDRVRVEQRAARHGSEYIRPESECYWSDRGGVTGRYDPSASGSRVTNPRARDAARLISHIPAAPPQEGVKARPSAAAGNTPVVCPHCGVTVSRMRRHLRRTHGMNTAAAMPKPRTVTTTPASPAQTITDPSEAITCTSSPAFPKCNTRFVGAWRLVAMERLRSNGAPMVSRCSEVYGTLLYDPSGAVSERIMKRPLETVPKDYWRLQPSEQIKLFAIYGGYDGSYKVNATAGVVDHTVRVGFNSMSARCVLRRRYEFFGTRLILTSPSHSSGSSGGIVRLVWERVS